MARIGRWDDARWQRSRGGVPARGGRLVIERLVGPHLVVGLYERVERPLLQFRVGRGGLDDFRFQDAMHALVRAVFLRTRRRNALMHDPELQPPRIEAIQSVNAVRREGRAVVAANGVRQPVGPKQPPQFSVHALRLHVGRTLAAQQVSTKVIDDRQRVAVHAIARTQLSFEVDGPHLVRRRRLQRGGAGMLPMRTGATAPHAIVSREDVEDRTARGQIEPRMRRLQPLQDLARAPAVAAVLGENQVDRRWWRLIGRRQRRAAVLLQAAYPERQEALAPFVARVATDAVARTARSWSTARSRGPARSDAARTWDRSPARASPSLRRGFGKC